MKRAVIFLNGNKPTRDLVFETVKTTDTIICADGGAKHVVAAGLTPHVIVGDLDSLPRQLQTKLRRLPIEWVTFSPEKDFTDSELALQYAIGKGFREIVFLGVFGDRADHLLANMLFFAKTIEYDARIVITIIEEKQTVYFVRERRELRGEKGQTVSLISLTGDALGVTTKGLKWKLNNEVLPLGVTRGVSNEIVGKKVSVTVKAGVVLLIHQKQRV